LNELRSIVYLLFNRNYLLSPEDGKKEEHALV
jgi:hypothetical protein